MSRRTIFALITVLLVIAALEAPSTTANAFATSEQATFGCDFFFVAGASNAPYVLIAVIPYVDVQDYYTIVPVIDGRYSGLLTFPKRPEGSLVWYTAGGITATGPVHPSNYWDDESYFDALANCATPLVETPPIATPPIATPSAIDAAIQFTGPGLPSGYVLKTITCDVAVFDAPGGNPVADNSLKLGQTWYVNPETRNDAVGEAWNEVFVSGYQNGYVPARCVS